MPISDTISLNRADLRQAMRDPRYWQSGHPERADYRGWVTDAWRQHQAGAGGDGLVWVKPYTRRRDGETHEVSGHFRQSSGGSAEDGRVVMEASPGGGVERRYTARDASGGLIGRCESLADGSQICTLAMPDGGITVQQLQAGEGEFTPVAAPAVARYGFALMLGVATNLYTQLQNWMRGGTQSGVAADTPFLLFYRGVEGRELSAQIAVGTLNDERVNQFCPKTAEFDELLGRIAGETPREGRSPQQWGMDVHRVMEHEVRLRYEGSPDAVRTEFSLSRGELATRGEAGSSRLDILHRVDGTDTICVYDIKTGEAGLGRSQAARIYREAFQYGQKEGIAVPQILVIELHRRP